MVCPEINVDPATGCTIEVYDDWTNTHCPNGDSSWEDADGTKGSFNAQTGCSETFFSDGGKDIWCEDGSGSYTDASGETDSWGTTD